MTELLNVFIGSGEASLIERKVLEYSIRKHCKNVAVHVYNGTHDTVEWADGRRERLNTPLDIKYANVTEFSNFRWFIPRLCGYRGRAMFIDSDMVCLADLGMFAEIDMQGAAMMAKTDAYKTSDGQPRWGMSMTLFVNEHCFFVPETWFQNIAAQKYSLTDLHQMTARFHESHPYQITPLPPGWNEFDRFESGHTKLIHYTGLGTQPWKYPGHPAGDLWFQYLHEAMNAGFVTQAMIDQQILRYYVRADLLKGNFTSLPSRLIRHGKNIAKELLRR
jgi:hypothetical protein